MSERTATSDRPVKIPGPEHPITIEPNPGRVIVSAGGRQVADTTRALTLREASHAPVQYIPLDDVDQSLLTPSDHETYCPFKGEASYYSIPVAGEGAVDAVWEYREPYDAVAPIRGHVAFYPNQVEIDERFDQD